MYSVPKASREDCYKFIMNDLDNTIIGNLPVTVPDEECGRYINECGYRYESQDDPLCT